MSGITVERVVLGGFIEVNCYLLSSGGRCLVVDPGSDAERLRGLLAARRLEPEGILLTHGHLDHIGAADAFDVPVWLHPDELDLARDPARNGFGTFGLPMPWDPSAIDWRPLPSEGVALDGETVSWVHVPGHTPGGVCYRFGEVLVSGDTLFAGAVGRWDFPGGDLEALKRSVVGLIDSLPDGVRILPGHGEATTSQRERRGNDYYLNWRG